MRRLLHFLLWLGGIGTLLGSCSLPPEQSDATSLTISAAASTSDVIRRLGEEFNSKSGMTVRVNVGSSSALAQQAMAGADVDLLLLASPQWVATLEQRQLVAKWEPLLGNQVTLVISGNCPRLPSSLEDLTREDYRQIAVGDPESVPAGQYAKAALEASGLWEVLKPKFIYGFDVRQVLAFVESGDVDAAFIYSSDAAIAPELRRALTLGPELTGEIIYPLVLLRRGNRAAEAFYSFLFSDSAGMAFTEAGFLSVARRGPRPPEQ